MLEVLVNHLGDVQFEVKARNHVLYCDQPAENGGYDEGMTPPELFLASLGTCAGFYAVQYLKANRLPLEGLKVRTGAEKASSPARIGKIWIDVDYPAGLDAKHRDGVLAAVHKCLIHNTLTHPPEIFVKVNGRAEKLAA